MQQRTRLVSVLTAFFVMITVFAHADTSAPMEIAGLKLGSSIRDAADRLDLASATPMFRLDALAHVEVKELPGFRSGYVTYGTCGRKDEILRIKLTYDDESLDLFERLLDALKKRYGKPEEWRGDPFGTLRTWKWSMRAENGHSISLILQHYAGDDESFSQGNTIRLADRTALDEETACFKGRMKDNAASGKDTEPRKRPAAIEDLLPR